MLIKNPIKRILIKTAPLLNIPYEVQLRMKENRIYKSLQKLSSIFIKSGKCPPEVLEKISKKKILPCELEPIQRSPVIDGYRNKAGATVGFDNSGNITVGHVINFESKSKNYKRQIIIPELCEKINKKHHILIIRLFEQFIRENSKFVPSQLSKINSWSGIMLRSNRQDDTMVHINFDGHQSTEEMISEAKRELLEKFLPVLLNKNLNIRSFYWQPNHFLMSVPELKFPSENIWGEKYITDSICHKTFYVSPRSFFQINIEVAEALYQSTRRLIEESIKICDRNILILDLCCGTGTLGIILSDLATKVIGVDITPSAIEDAKYNATMNNISNIEHVCHDVEKFLAEFIKSEESRKYDDVIAVVNPSRMGLNSRFCRKLREYKTLNMIIYLSCKFEGKPSMNIFHLCKQSKTRNLGNPFLMIKAVPLDMFPHTRYVELVLKLVR